MKGKKFSISAWIFSLLGAGLGAAAAAYVFAMLSSGSGEPSSARLIFWSGIFFLAVFLGGFLGMTLAFRFSGKYTVCRKRGWQITFLLSAALLFGTGAAGQALFMYSREKVVVPASVDIVLLLDYSYSMEQSGYDEARTEAACQFVDILDEECCLQVIPYTVIVKNEEISSFLMMDDQGKREMKDFIRSIDITGATDFNEPLKKAKETLDEKGRSGAYKTVILLTDGESYLDSDVTGAYISSDIIVFSVCINSSGVLSYNAQELADFAVNTGGFDLQITPDASGNVDAVVLLDAFWDAFESTSEMKDTMSNHLLIYSESTSVYQFIVRLITMLICAVLFALGYFGKISLPGAASGLVCGTLLAVLLSLGISYIFNILMICLLMASAFVCFKEERGEAIDV